MVPRDCYDIQQLCGSKSGVYYIFPHINDDAVEVYCDMKTDQGGWLVSELVNIHEFLLQNCQSTLGKLPTLLQECSSHPISAHEYIIQRYRHNKVISNPILCPKTRTYTFNHTTNNDQSVFVLYFSKILINCLIKIIHFGSEEDLKIRTA